MAMQPSMSVWRSMLHLYMSGRPLHLAARRTFSSSGSQSRGALPVFEQASTKDLSDLLVVIRERILVTGYLNPQQQELVFHPKWRSTLENEPVYANVGDEEVQLKPLDRFKDMPNRWKSFHKALEMTTSDGDWRNMIKMIQGYHTITKGRHMDSGRLQKFMRRAQMQGQVSKVWQCLWKVDSTGMTLSDPGIAKAAFVWCISDVLREQEYGKNAVRKAWTRVRDLLQMMEMPGHCGGALVEGDLRQQPWVVGVVLEVAALWEKMRWPAGDGPKVEVEKYVDRLLDCTERYPLNAMLLELPDTTSQGLSIGAHAEVISKLLPLWHGLNMAQEILGSTYARASLVEETKNTAASLIEQLVEDIESNKHPDRVYPAVKAWRDLAKR